MSTQIPETTQAEISRFTAMVATDDLPAEGVASFLRSLWVLAYTTGQRDMNRLMMRSTVSAAQADQAEERKAQG